MRKSMLKALYAVLMGLFIYSCSEFVLPDQIGLKGTLSLPIRIGAANLNETLKTKIEDAFSAGKQEGTIVYNVDYGKDQTVQTFCLYIPIKMTKDLNPSNFLKTIDEHINGGIDTEPKAIGPISLPYETSSIVINDKINLFNGSNSIPAVSLADIAQYVNTVYFDICREDVDSGIGLDFYLEEKIPEGLQMILTCEEIDVYSNLIRPLFTTGPKTLHQGHNKFGNEEKILELEVFRYSHDERMLRFTVKLQSVGPDTSKWDIVNDGTLTGTKFNIKGNVSIFREWTEAKIDLAKALLASSTDDNVFGKYPTEAFNLSVLRDYLDGGFEFTNDLKVKIYMNGPFAEYMGYKLIMMALYDGDDDGKELCSEYLSVSPESMEIRVKSDLNEKGYYKYKNLPGNPAEDVGVVNEDTIKGIFIAKPEDLFFKFKIQPDEEDKLLTITRDSFHDIGDSGSIVTTMMIMLPMSLIAIGDNSSIYLPNMFGEKHDLFGREEPKELFSKGNIDYIRLTIDFSNPIFTGGYLFINEDKDLFPQGIRLNGKGTVLDFTDEQIKRVEKDLIKPNIRIEFDNGGTINIPKDMAIMSIRLDIKGIVNVGDL